MLIRANCLPQGQLRRPPGSSSGLSTCWRMTSCRRSRSAARSAPAATSCRCRYVGRRADRRGPRGARRGRALDAAEVLAERPRAGRAGGQGGARAHQRDLVHERVRLLAVADARELAGLAELCTALSSEALLGNRDHFTASFDDAKPHPGRSRARANVRELLATRGSPRDSDELVRATVSGAGSVELERRVQDKYSIRCAPHVVGVLRDTLDWAEDWLTTEINSSNDNPLFDAATGTVHYGGNFYGGHVAQAWTLKVALAEPGRRPARPPARARRGREVQRRPHAEPGRRPGRTTLRRGCTTASRAMQIAASALTAEALKLTTPTSSSRARPRRTTRTR